MYTHGNTPKQASSQLNKPQVLQTAPALLTEKNPFISIPGVKSATNFTVTKSNKLAKSAFAALPFSQEGELKTLASFASKNRIKKGAGSVVAHKLPEKQVFDLNVSMTWFVDEDDYLTHADSAFLHFLNIEKKDLNRKLSDILPETIKEKFLKAHLSVRVSGIPSKKIIMQPLPDGTSKQLFITIYPFTNHYDKNFLVGEAFDITDDLPVQEKAAQTDERLDLLKITMETFWESDIKSGYVSGNEELNKLIGLNPNKATNPKDWYSLIHPKDRKRVKTTHKNTIKDIQPNWEHEFRLKTINRGYITLHEKGLIIYDRGKAVKMIGSLRDITEIKTLASKLLKEKANLRKKIIRTNVIAQEKERMHLGNELHDNVNQLLVASKLFLEVIKTVDQKSAEMKDNVSQYIATACEEIRNLSHGLVIANFGQNGLVGSFKKILDDLALSGTFEISFNHDEKIETLNNSKKITLLRILQEQTKNIIRHSRATKIDIGLTLVNNKVQFYIRDNGIGFDLRTLRRGIGLSNIYDRVKLYNGSVEINSSPGMGCKLNIAIPGKGK